MFEIKFKTISIILSFTTILFVLVFISNNNSNNNRQLSINTDLVTGENLRTVDGNVPLASCPVGYFRPPGSTNMKLVAGQREEGCVPCPRGRYGDTIGLKTALCTAPCPPGKYNDEEGGISLLSCKLCEPGTYAVRRGSKECSEKCPKGRYSDTYGNSALSSCKVCLPNYFDWQCPKKIT